MITEYNHNIPLATYFKLKDFVDRANIGEDFDYNCTFKFTLENEGNILGVIAFRIEEFLTYGLAPRFIHIIFDKSIQRSKQALKFIWGVEDLMKAKGFTNMFAYILHQRIGMAILARKLGFKDLCSTDNGYYLYKPIGERNVRKH